MVRSSPALPKLALLLTATSALALPANANILYDPCFELLDIRHASSEEASADSDELCLERDPLGGGGGGGTEVGDPTKGAPTDEYLDLVTNVVYRYDGTSLKAVGLSSPMLGYGTVHAYPPGARPLPTTGDQKGACTAVYYCVSFNVALTGAHAVDVVAFYNDACQGTTETLWSAPTPAAGTPVTAHRGIRLEPVPPEACLAGTVLVVLIIDGSSDPSEGIHYASSVTNY